MSATIEDFINGTQGQLLANFLNGFKFENNNFIVGSGQVLNVGDFQQSHKALAIFAARGDFYQEAGGSAADVYVLQNVGAQAQIFQYKDGMRIRFRVVNTNTGSSTVNINGLGAKSIKFVANNLLAGMILLDEIIELVFDESNDEFQLQESAWANYVPTYGADGAMTFTAVVTNVAKFKYKNKHIFVCINATGTTGGVASRYVSATLPIDALMTNQTGSGQVQPGTGRFGAVVFAATVSELFIGNGDNSDWGLGTNRNFSCDINYEI